MTEPAGTFGTMPQEPWHPGKGVELDCVIQLNCGEVCTHANYKTTRTWEDFNNQGTKIILLSDELWLISNNSKSFANRSKLIIRNNLNWGSTLKFTLFRTFRNIVMDLMVQKYRFGKEKYIKQINDIQEWQKRQWNSVIQWKKVMSEIYLKLL